LPHGRVIPIFTGGASVLPQHEIHDKDDHDEEEHTADMEDALKYDLGDNLSNILGDHPR
jgi:hypothetical protein